MGMIQLKGPRGIALNMIAAVSTLSFCLIFVVRFARDNAAPANAWVVFLLGVAPNFLGALALSFGMFFFLLGLLSQRYSRLTRLAASTVTILIVTLSGAILVWWEHHQLRGNLVFDPDDIAATYIGCARGPRTCGARQNVRVL
jgi:amino acid transporter